MKKCYQVVTRWKKKIIQLPNEDLEKRVSCLALKQSRFFIELRPRDLTQDVAISLFVFYRLQLLKVPSYIS